MAYTPHASEVSQPLDTVDRSTAAAEFRELKSHVNGMSTVASATTPDIFNNTNKIISYTGAVLATGFAAAPAAGAERLLYCTGACSFTAGANLIIDGTPNGNTLVVAAGYVLQVIALTATQFKMMLISPVVVATATNLTGGSFSVHKNGVDQATIAEAVPTLVTWSTEEFDSAGLFAANRFTPNAEGKYLLSVSLMLTAVWDQGSIDIEIRKNSSGTGNKMTRNTLSGGAPGGVSMSATVAANGTTDYFEVYIFHISGGSARTLSGNIYYTWFTGCRVGG